MPADTALYRHSGKFFVAFLALTVLAFWPSYFARLFEQPNIRFHLHGAALFSWCAMLVAQAQLIRTRRRALHRQIGRASYVLAPALVAITASFVHYRVAGAVPPMQPLPPGALHFLALTLNALVAFAVLYGLAIYFRRDPQTHARYMLCTVFPLFTPVTDRLIAVHYPPLIALVPRMEGAPVLPVAGFVLADVILAGLALWDWRVNGRRNVFPVALGVLLAYHVSVLTFHRVAVWETLCRWFLAAPLS